MHTFILNILNHLLQDESYKQQIMESQALQERAFQFFIVSVFNPSHLETNFRFSLYIFLTNLSYIYEGEEFFDSYINVEDFLERFHVNFKVLQGANDQQAFLSILNNITFQPDYQKLLVQHPKALEVIRDIFSQKFID